MWPSSRSLGDPAAGELGAGPSRREGGREGGRGGGRGGEREGGREGVREQRSEKGMDGGKERDCLVLLLSVSSHEQI